MYQTNVIISKNLLKLGYNLTQTKRAANLDAAVLICSIQRTVKVGNKQQILGSASVRLTLSSTRMLAIGGYGFTIASFEIKMFKNALRARCDFGLVTAEHMW